MLKCVLKHPPVQVTFLPLTFDKSCGFSLFQRHCPWDAEYDHRCRCQCSSQVVNIQLPTLLTVVTRQNWVCGIVKSLWGRTSVHVGTQPVGHRGSNLFHWKLFRFRWKSGSFKQHSRTARMLPYLLTKWVTKIVKHCHHHLYHKQSKHRRLEMRLTVHHSPSSLPRCSVFIV